MDSLCLKRQRVTTLFCAKNSSQIFPGYNVCSLKVYFYQKLVSTKENKDLGKLPHHWIWWIIFAVRRNLITAWFSSFDFDHIFLAQKSHYELISIIEFDGSYFLCPEIILWIDFLHLNLIIFFLKSWILKTIFCERIDLSSFEFYHILCAKKSYYELIVFIWLW